ncbi:hypothetical protein BC941DRAFT_477186 [Chlamydoabsidia padenii]|nr:hypothetical protein BC941DRAFT_477186 [Chlamydoabsidia padenii]
MNDLDEIMSAIPMRKLERATRVGTEDLVLFGELDAATKPLATVKPEVKPANNMVNVISPKEIPALATEEDTLDRPIGSIHRNVAKFITHFEKIIFKIINPPSIAWWTTPRRLKSETQHPFLFF